MGGEVSLGSSLTRTGLPLIPYRLFRTGSRKRFSELPFVGRFFPSGVVRDWVCLLLRIRFLLLWQCVSVYKSLIRDDCEFTFEYIMLRIAPGPLFSERAGSDFMLYNWVSALPYPPPGMVWVSRSTIVVIEWNHCDLIALPYWRFSVLLYSPTLLRNYCAGVLELVGCRILLCSSHSYWGMIVL